MGPRRFLTTAAGIAVGALALAGCAGGGGSEGDVTLTFVAPIYSDATEAYWKDLVSAFEAEHDDITIDLQLTAWSDLPQKVNTLVSTQQTPDILNYNSFASFAADDLLLPIEDVLPEDAVSDFIPALLDNGQYDGVTYGIPLIASVRTMFYNTDLFDAAGITEPPTTWDEMVEDAKKIKDAGAAAGWGLAYGQTELDADLSGFMFNSGGEWKDGDTWTIDSADNQAALQFMTDLVNEYKVTQDGGSSAKRADTWQLFGQGQIGMIQGSNFLPTLLKGQGSTANIAAAPMPTSNGAEPSALGIQDFMMAFKSTDHPDEVKEFLTYFYQADNYEKFITAEGFLPTTQSAADVIVAADPSQEPFIEQLKTAKFFPNGDPAWPTVQGEIRKTLGTAIGGEVSAADMLASLQTLATTN